jgi:hypothetical protein
VCEVVFVHEGVSVFYKYTDFIHNNTHLRAVLLMDTHIHTYTHNTQPRTHTHTHTHTHTYLWEWSANV